MTRLFSSRRRRRDAWVWGLASLCSLVLTTSGASAQRIAWSDQFGTAAFDAMYATDESDGDVYSIGEFDDAPGGCDVALRAHRGSGFVKWTHVFGTPGCDFAEGISATDNGIYAGGWVTGALPGQTHSGSVDAFARRYDEDGRETWTRQFGTAASDAVRAVASDGRALYAVGRTGGAFPGHTNVGALDVFIRKFDADGKVLWTRQFGTADDDVARSVATGPGGIVVVGQVLGSLPDQSGAGGSDVFVSKYSANGKEVWTRQFGSPGEDIAFGVAVAGNSIYVVGDVGGQLPGHPFEGGPLDAFVRKYDATGDEQWTQLIGTAGFDRAIRVAADDTRVAVVGRVGGALPGETFAGGSTDPFVRMYDPSGSEVWTLQFGGRLEPEAAVGVTFGDDEGDLFVSGGIGGALPGHTSAGGVDAFVLKILTE